MKLYQKKIPVIAADIVTKLTADGDIETSQNQEVQLDVEAVMNEYVRMDREISEKARDRLKNSGLSYEHFGRVKRQMANEKEFVLGEEAVRYISNQIIEVFMQSNHVEEIFSDDYSIREKVEVILTKYMTLDEEINEEVKKHIKNLEEGSSTWDIEYKKTLERIKNKYNL